MISLIVPRPSAGEMLPYCDGDDAILGQAQ